VAGSRSRHVGARGTTPTVGGISPRIVRRGGESCGRTLQDQSALQIIVDLHPTVGLQRERGLHGRECGLCADAGVRKSQSLLTARWRGARNDEASDRSITGLGV
jgi:hypothetical protein